MAKGCWEARDTHARISSKERTKILNCFTKFPPILYKFKDIVYNKANNFIQ